jgi:DNA-binding XRE family transcriptional regulator
MKHEKKSHDITAGEHLSSRPARRVPPKTEGEAKVRIMLAGIQREAIERRLRQAAPSLDLIAPEKGEPPELVAMALEDYQRLVDQAENNAAVAAYERTREEESVPAEVTDRLLAGENPIRVWREHRGMSLEQLAAAIGKHKGFLSEIESGKKTGSVETLRAIAEALRVDLDEIA